MPAFRAAPGFVLAAVDSISLSSRWLSPNSDGRQDTILYTFAVQAPVQAIVQVATPGQPDTLATIQNDPITGIGRRNVSGSWDGRINGVVVPDGAYDFRFLTVDTLQNVSSNRRQFLVDTVAPMLDSLSITPRPFTPTVAGTLPNLVTRFAVSQSQLDDTIGVEILQGADTLGVAVLGGFAGDGSYTAPCYSCADDLVDGMATVEVFALDNAGNQTLLVDSLDVNRMGPRVTLTYPTVAAVLQADSLVGNAVDRQTIASVSMIVTGALDTVLVLPTTSVPDTGRVDFRVDVSQLFAAEGVYALRFPALDVDGVSDSTRIFTLRVDRTAPPRPTLTVPLPTETRAREVVVSVRVDSTAKELRITGAAIPITPIAINSRPLVSGVSLPLNPGLNLLTFQVVDDAGNLSPVETAQIRRITSEGLSVPERFHAGNTISVDAGSVAQGVEVRILAMDGALVRLFESSARQREYVFPWNLQTPEGRQVRNGAYLVVASVEVNGQIERYRKMIAVIE